MSPLEEDRLERIRMLSPSGGGKGEDRALLSQFTSLLRHPFFFQAFVIGPESDQPEDTLLLIVVGCVLDLLFAVIVKREE